MVGVGTGHAAACGERVGELGDDRCGAVFARRDICRTCLPAITRPERPIPPSSHKQMSGVGRGQRYPVSVRRAVLNRRWYAAGLMDSSLANTRRRLS
jgi:hypothetical protein